MHVSRDRGERIFPEESFVRTFLFRGEPEGSLHDSQIAFQRDPNGAKRNRSPWEFTFCWPPPPTVESTESKATEMLWRPIPSLHPVSRTKKLKAILTDTQGSQTGDKAFD